MAQVPIEFSSYGLGSAKAQALQDEVDMMLQKNTLELIHELGPGLLQSSVFWGAEGN